METVNFSNFTNYKQLVMELNGDLTRLRDFSKALKLEGCVKSLDEVIKRLSEDTFNVAIVGEFKRGKSTLINALLEKSILPSDVMPTTATLNKVTYGITPFARIEYLDGHTEDIQVEELENYVTKLTPESEQIAQTVKVATVFYPINYCKNGVTIIDTPGLNDNEAMTEVTLSVLPETDAAIMVMMCGAPFSQSECEFLEQKIMACDVGRVLFVVTGIDLYDEEDREKLMRVFRKRITDAILVKAKTIYGEDSEEYQAYLRKLGNIRIYGVNAKGALKAKKKKDETALVESQFPVFEEALEKFLVEERGAITLSVPVNRIKASSVEIIKAAELREVALQMESDEFQKKYTRAMEEIQSIREERSREFQKISSRADAVYEQLKPIMGTYWKRMKDTAFQAVDAFPLTSVENIDQGLTEQMMAAVRKGMQAESQNVSERIQNIISAGLAEEADRLSGFEEYFYTATEEIQNVFTGGRSASNLSTAEVVFSTFINGYAGLGNLFIGYKEAGWKGVLLGGGVGLASWYASGTAFLSLMSALAISVTPGLNLLALAVAAIGSTFGTRFVLGKLFRQDKVQKFKEDFKESLEKEINRIREESAFSKGVREQVDAAFDALKDRVYTETERILGDTQVQLNQLQMDVASSTSMEKQERAELKDMLEVVNGICQRAEAVGKQLSAIMIREEDATCTQ